MFRKVGWCPESRERAPSNELKSKAPHAKPTCWAHNSSFACLWRIDMLIDSAGDRWPPEGNHSCETHSVAMTRSNQLTWAHFEAQDSKWSYWKCRLPISAGCHREHSSLENQAAMGV
jgi:hypothetical protein